MVVTAMALFFSTFSSPFLSVACTLALYVIGHFGEDLKHLDNLVASRALATIGRGIYYVMPNLAPLDVKGRGRPRRGRQAAAHAARRAVERLYIAALLVTASTLSFRAGI